MSHLTNHMPGLNLGDYELLDVVSTGDMGIVYRARHTLLDKVVAIKIFSDEWACNADFISEFRRRAEMVAKVRHPAIVSIVDFVSQSDPPLFGYITEFIEGIPLEEIIASRVLSVEQCLQVGAQLLNVLQAIHSVGIVHHELKPDNIFIINASSITHTTQVPTVRILDFATTKPAQAIGQALEDELIIGTPAYMSPEQLSGKSVGPAADIYAWALILVEMLSGQPVFEGSIKSILRQKLNAEPLVVNMDVSPEYLDSLSGIIHNCVSFEPALRPPADEALALFASLLVDVNKKEKLYHPRNNQSRSNSLSQYIIWRPKVEADIPYCANWRIDSQLDDSHWSDTWKARHEANLELPRVFKFGYDDVSLEALKREVQVSDKIQSAFGTRDDILLTSSAQFNQLPYYVATPYVGKGNLIQYVEELGGYVTKEKRLSWVMQAAEALAAAHSIGVIHGNITPENILIRSTDDSVVLAGFGSRDLNIDSDSIESNEKHRYLAPECKVKGPCTIQADIYSLGVVIYQLLVGDFYCYPDRGWEDQLTDPILIEDLRRLLNSSPKQRLGDANEIVRLMASQDTRREQKCLDIEREKAYLVARWFRRFAIPSGIALAIFGGAMAIQASRIAKEAEQANIDVKKAHMMTAASEQTLDLLVDVFHRPEFENKPSSIQKVLDEGVENIERTLTDQPQVKARLLSAMARVYANLALYDRAQALSEQVLALRQAVFGYLHSKVAKSYHDIGQIQTKRSQFDLAAAAHERALTIRRQTLSGKHPDVAESLTMVAEVAYLRGEAEQAEQLYVQALELLTEVFDDKSLPVAHTTHHLGWLYAQEGRWTEAEEKLGDALEWLSHQLGDEHYEVAAVLNHLAFVYMNTKRLDEAEHAAGRALVIQEGSLSVDYRDRADSVFILGQIKRRQMEYATSLGFFSQAIELFSELLGVESYQVGQSHYYRGLSHQQLEGWEAAEKDYQTALSVYRSISGEQSIDVVKVLNGLGVVLGQGLKDYSSGEKMLTQALNLLDKSKKTDLYLQGLVRWNLANILRDEGQIEKADLMYREAIKFAQVRDEQEEGRDTDLAAMLTDYDKMKKAGQKAERDNRKDH